MSEAEVQFRIPANKPYFTKEDRLHISFEIQKILETGRLTQGPWVRKFEESFAEYVGVKYTVATNSGTSALEILLRYFDVKEREVIVPTNTFLSTANAVIFAGGKPVLADISADTLCIDPDEVQQRMTAKTKGVIIVHVAGLISPQIDDVRGICRRNGLFLIEDAAHAPGAAINFKKAGTLADGAAFSFYPSKPMTTGEGGMITTNDSECAQFARSIRSHGISLDDNNKSLLVRLGNNWRMSELQAVMGCYQLRNLDDAISRRNQVVENYEDALKGVAGIRMFEVQDNIRHSYHKFPVLFDTQFSRKQIVDCFKDDFGIQVGSIYWPPCHLQPFYKNYFGYDTGDFPVAENILQRTFALPIYPEMSEEDAAVVSQALHKIIEENIFIHS